MLSLDSVASPRLRAPAPLLQDFVGTLGLVEGFNRFILLARQHVILKLECVVWLDETLLCYSLTVSHPVLKQQFAKQRFVNLTSTCDIMSPKKQNTKDAPASSSSGYAVNIQQQEDTANDRAIAQLLQMMENMSLDGASKEGVETMVKKAQEMKSRFLMIEKEKNKKTPEQKAEEDKKKAVERSVAAKAKTKAKVQKLYRYFVVVEGSDQPPYEIHPTGRSTLKSIYTEMAKQLDISKSKAKQCVYTYKGVNMGDFNRRETTGEWHMQEDDRITMQFPIITAPTPATVEEETTSSEEELDNMEVCNEGVDEDEDTHLREPPKKK